MVSPFEMQSPSERVKNWFLVIKLNPWAYNEIVIGLNRVSIWEQPFRELIKLRFPIPEYIVIIGET